MKDRRLSKRYKVKCTIQVSSKKLINGIVEDISKTGVKIRLIDTITDKEFYEEELEKTHQLEFSLKDIFEREYKAKLIRIDSTEENLMLSYQFLNKIELPEKILIT